MFQLIRIIEWGFVAALCSVTYCSMAFGDSQIPSRTIHLVYDDSGSMIRSGETYVDTWCQAKYAMEVVAAMLDERDALNIYYMSDYDAGTSAPPRLQLHGSRDAHVVAGNVDKIHQLVTPFGNTPFNAVRKASEDLKSAQADERWLVVLTDGEFEDGKMSGKAVEEYLTRVARDKIQIILLAMGSQAASIPTDAAKGIFFEHATSTKDILPKLTSVCNRIFQRNALSISQNNRDYSMSFGVPMRQLIVFAQGKSASIGDMIQAEDKSYKSSSSVHAMYSTQSSVQNPPGAIIADDLNGYVSIFDGEFEPGTYKLNITNADSIEVYYKPDVAINGYLFDLDGNEVTDSADIVNGQYKLQFGFVNARTQAKVSDTSLLGDITYQSSLINTAVDGAVSNIEASSGDTITLKEGTVDIDVTARYLDYNTVHTKLHYQVFFRNELVYSIDSMPDYALTAEGIQNGDKPFVIDVKMKDGEELVPLSPEQWSAMEPVKVTTKAKVGHFIIKKEDKPGVFHVYPSLDDILPMEAEPGELPIVVSGGFNRGKSSAAGRMESKVVLQNGISSLERVLDWLKNNWGKTILGLIGFILIIGWCSKPRFSKKIKNKPMIHGKPSKRGAKNSDIHAAFQKKLTPCLLPYMAERAVLRFAQTGIPRFDLKAGRDNKIILVNAKSFKDTKKYEFVGKEIKDGREFSITPSTEFTAKTDEYKYSLTLDNDK